jgi:hypothetical protein
MFRTAAMVLFLILVLTGFLDLFARLSKMAQSFHHPQGVTFGQLLGIL